MKRILQNNLDDFSSLVFGFLLIGIFYFSAIGNLNLSNQILSSKVGFISLIVISSMVVGFLNWKASIKFVLYLAVIEGAFRKWVIPEQSTIVYFVKDFFIFFSYFGYWFHHRKIRFPDLFPSWKFLNCILLILAVYCFFQLFNSRLSHFAVGVLGFKAYFLYVPLIYLLSELFETEDEFNRFLHHFIVFAIPIALLGMFQFFQPAGSAINRYVWSEQPIAVFGLGSQPRVTGTFSYLAGYSVYLLFVFCITVGFSLLKAKGVVPRILEYIVLICTVGNLLMTGSRGPILQAAVVLFCFVVFLGKRFFQFFRKYLLRLILLAIILFFAIYRFFPVAFESFKYRTIHAGAYDTQSRIQQILSFPQYEMELAGWFGYGIGSTHQASNQLLNFFELGSVDSGIDIYYEEEPERMMLELGMIGFFLFYLFKISLCFCCYRLMQSLDKSHSRAQAFSLLLFVLVNFFNPLVFNHIFNVLFWYSVGLMIALYRLNTERHEFQK